jgi:uncharacterized protein YndB with AHSA1/START domain
MMGPISLTTTIDASRERVFDLICDLAARPAWADNFISDYRLERIAATGPGAAARFRVAAPGGIKYMETVIAEADRPHRVLERGRGGRLDRIPIQTLWELKEGPGAVTTLILTFETDPATIIDRARELGREGWWRRRWRRSLRRMQELIESGVEPPRAASVAGSA